MAAEGRREWSARAEATLLEKEREDRDPEALSGQFINSSVD